MTETVKDSDKPDVLPADQVLPLLQALPAWGNFVTIVFVGGSVFEFKGPFPEGTLGEGFYNLDGPTPGLHGHLRLANLTRVRFQDRPHRGRDSYAFVFEDERGGTVFKVFLGRDASGEVFPEQLAVFRELQQKLVVQSVVATTQNALESA